MFFFVHLFLQELTVCTRGHATTPVVRRPSGRSRDPHFPQPARLLLQSQVSVVHAGQQHQLGLHTVSGHASALLFVTPARLLPAFSNAGSPLEEEKRNKNKFDCKQAASSIKQPSEKTHAKKKKPPFHFQVTFCSCLLVPLCLTLLLSWLLFKCLCLWLLPTVHTLSQRHLAGPIEKMNPLKTACKMCL